MARCDRYLLLGSWQMAVVRANRGLTLTAPYSDAANNTIEFKVLDLLLVADPFQSVAGVVTPIFNR